MQELTDAGMSTRAIGSALGVGDKTVHRDLAGVSGDTPEPTNTATETTTTERQVDLDTSTGNGPELEHILLRSAYMFLSVWLSV